MAVELSGESDDGEEAELSGSNGVSKDVEGAAMSGDEDCGTIVIGGSHEEDVDDVSIEMDEG